MDEVELTSTLMGLNLLSGLEYEQVEDIRQAGQVVVLAAGATVSQAETVDECLTVFLNGALRIESVDGVLLAEVTEVRVLGEMGVLVGQARSSRVVAERETTVFQLMANDLQILVEADLEVAQRMLTNLCAVLYDRQHGANEEIEELRTDGDALRLRLAEVSPDDPLLRT